MRTVKNNQIWKQMDNEAYEISPRIGRLRKRVRFRKEKSRKSGKQKFSKIIQHPIIIFIIVAMIGIALYFSLQEPGRKSRKNPSLKSTNINRQINEERNGD